jgi:hypothetical protein
MLVPTSLPTPSVTTLSHNPTKGTTENSRAKRITLLKSDAFVTRQFAIMLSR